MIHRCCTLLLFALLASLSGGCSWSMKMPPESKRAVMLHTENAATATTKGQWEQVALDAPTRLDMVGWSIVGWHASVSDSRVVVNSEPTSVVAPSVPPEGSLAAHGDYRLSEEFKLTRLGRQIKLESMRGPIATGVHAQFSPSGKHLVAAFWARPYKLDPYGDTTPCHVRVWDTASGALVTWFKPQRFRFDEASSEVLVANDRDIFYIDWDESYFEYLSVVDIDRAQEIERVRFEPHRRISGGRSGFVVWDDLTKPVVMLRMREPTTRERE